MTEQTSKSGTPPRRAILVIKLGALGDIILAMEAFQAIRKHHPADSITLLTRRQFVGLTEQMPWFDAIIAAVSVNWPV